jgi:protein transport protein SEC24
MQISEDLADVALDRKQIEMLLNVLPGMMEARPDGNRIAAGSAIKGALAGLVRFSM